MLLSFRLALQKLQEWLEIALRDSDPEFSSPDSQTGNCIIAFGLCQHTLGSSDVNDGCQTGSVTRLLLLFAAVSSIGVFAASLRAPDRIACAC